MCDVREDASLHRREVGGIRQEERGGGEEGGLDDKGQLIADNYLSVQLERPRPRAA